MVFEFTDEIPLEQRSSDPQYANLDNWDERKAKESNDLCCHDCRWFSINSKCSNYVGAYHKTCSDFMWW